MNAIVPLALLVCGFTAAFANAADVNIAIPSSCTQSRNCTAALTHALQSCVAHAATAPCTVALDEHALYILDGADHTGALVQFGPGTEPSPVHLITLDGRGSEIRIAPLAGFLALEGLQHGFALRNLSVDAVRQPYTLGVVTASPDASATTLLVADARTRYPPPGQGPDGAPRAYLNAVQSVLQYDVARGRPAVDGYDGYFLPPTQKELRWGAGPDFAGRFLKDATSPDIWWTVDNATKHHVAHCVSAGPGFAGSFLKDATSPDVWWTADNATKHHVAQCVSCGVNWCAHLGVVPAATLAALTTGAPFDCASCGVDVCAHLGVVPAATLAALTTGAPFDCTSAPHAPLANGSAVVTLLGLGATLPVGATFILRHQVYALNGVSASSVRGLAIEDVTLWSMPGMGFVGGECSGVTLSRVRVAKRAWSDVDADGQAGQAYRSSNASAFEIFDFSTFTPGHAGSPTSTSEGPSFPRDDCTQLTHTHPPPT